MKLRSYLILLLAVSSILSCSKDEEIEKVEPVETNGMLSLAVDANVKTKAADVDPKDRIIRLTILVFNEAGNFVAMKDSALTETDKADLTKSIEAVEPFAVSAGSLQVLAIANAKETAADLKNKSLAQIRECVIDLTNEKHSNLTMNSKIKGITVRAGKLNHIGRVASGDTEYCIDENPMKLYRNVARIELASLNLQKKTSYGEALGFELDSVFVANVKSKAYLVPTQDLNDESAQTPNWGTTEFANEGNTWWHGAYKTGDDHYVGPLRLNDGETKSFLAYDFNRDYNTWASSGFPYYDESRTDMDKNITLQPGDTYPATITGKPVGTFFYAYENMAGGAGAQTVLVVSGTYTYKTDAGAIVVMPNRYYAVVVNKGTANEVKGVAAHEYVKRNTKYNIAMTLTGPGSDKPYDPSVAAHVSASIKVLNWNVVTVTDTTD